MPKVDARVQNTQETVRNVFLELLNEKPIRKITVTEICRLSDINRTTFYKHYLDVYDLMEQTEQFMIDMLRERVSAMENLGVDEPLSEIMYWMKENGMRFTPLFGPNGNSGLIVKLSRECYPMFKKYTKIPQSINNDNTLEKICYSYISSGSAGILGYWMQSHFEQSPEEIADLLLQLVKYTLEGAAKM